MNKKFSTLLAAFLVAGGLGSSAFAQTAFNEFDLNNRVRLVESSSNWNLIVGESSNRDSLALVDPNNLQDEMATINGSHKQNWQLSVTPVKDANGFTTSYDVYLENQVNGAVALTKEDGTPKSFYYSPGAVVASGKMKIANVAVSVGDGTKSYYDAKNNKLYLLNDFKVRFRSQKYDAATKTKTRWILQKNDDNVIKLVAGTFTFPTGRPSSTADINNTEVKYKIDGVTYNSDLQFEIQSITDGYYANNLLNEVGNKSFQLAFSNEVTSGSAFGNVLSATELSVVTDAIVYSAAKYYAKEYNDVVADAKEDIAEVAQIKTDLQSYAREMEVALTAAVKTSGSLSVQAPAISSSEYSGIIDYL